MGGEKVQLTDVKMLNHFSAVMDERGFDLFLTVGNEDYNSTQHIRVDNFTDISVMYVDYEKNSLMPGKPLSIYAKVKNNGLITTDGLYVKVKDSNDNVLFEKKVASSIASGAADYIIIDCVLPETVDFSTLSVSVEPDGQKDSNDLDNSAECSLCLKDLSIENILAIKKHAVE